MRFPCSRFGFIASCAALALTFPCPMSPARAQTAKPEPTYTLSLPGGQTAFVGLQVGQTPEGKALRVFPRSSGGLPPTHLLEMTVTLGADGRPVSSFSKFEARSAPHAPIYQEMIPGLPDADGKPTYQQRVPRVTGSLSYTGPIMTSPTLMLFLGRLYDWKKGGEQSFLYLTEIGVTVPTLTKIYFAADGEEEIELDSGKVRARRLKYRAELPHLPKEQQTGKAYIGPKGELLSVPNSVFVIPFKLKEPGKYDAATRTLELTVGSIPELRVAVRGQQKRGGVEASIVFNRTNPLSTALLDSRFGITYYESQFPGRKMTADARGGTLRWALEETPPTQLRAGGEYPLLLPQWMVSEVWEDGNGPYAGMQVGETRTGCHLPLYFGVPLVNPFAVERMPDRAVTIGGAPVTVHHFRFNFSADPGKAKVDNIYDAYTDGRRLIALISVGGAVKIRRDGWEAYTNTLQPPTLPGADKK